MSQRTLKEEWKQFWIWTFSSPLNLFALRFPVWFFVEQGWIPKKYTLFWIAFLLTIFASIPLQSINGNNLNMWVALDLLVASCILLGSEIFVYRYSKLAFVFALVPFLFVVWIFVTYVFYTNPPLITF